MRNTETRAFKWPAMVVAVGLVATAPLTAQTAGVPRASDGHPDLSGTWDNGAGIDFVQPRKDGASICIFGCPGGGQIPANVEQPSVPKYRPEFSDRFGCLQDSRAFCQGFFRWYNQEHCHSGLGLLTPAMVHYGQAESVLQQRQAVLDVAYQLHPERFVRSAPKPPALPTAVWINKPVPTAEPRLPGGGR